MANIYEGMTYALYGAIACGVLIAAGLGYLLWRRFK